MHDQGPGSCVAGDHSDPRKQDCGPTSPSTCQGPPLRAVCWGPRAVWAARAEQRPGSRASALPAGEGQEGSACLSEKQLFSYFWIITEVFSPNVNTILPSSSKENSATFRHNHEKTRCFTWTV